VLYLKGGTHHSVAVEFADHIVVIEAPQSEQRSLAVIAEVKKQIPNKPIRYLVNTHHHFDHSGGLRTYVDEGATIVTHQINRAFYERTFAAPRTLNPDRLAASMKKATLETVTDLLVLADSKVIGDNTRTIELHRIRDNTHNDGILMAYLPKEKILIQGDMFTPPTPQAGQPAQATNAPAPVNPNTISLVENIERLGLDFQQILPLHGPGAATRADLYRAAGRTAAN
jgi:glyoxylase-like metal-dependent hydrolase (beta-lactamase superfamily II)